MNLKYMYKLIPQSWRLRTLEARSSSPNYAKSLLQVENFAPFCIHTFEQSHKLRFCQIIVKVKAIFLDTLTIHCLRVHARAHHSVSSIFIRQLLLHAKFPKKGELLPILSTLRYQISVQDQISDFTCKKSYQRKSKSTCCQYRSKNCFEDL